MRCEEAKERLLRCDLSALVDPDGAIRDGGDPGLARHLSACGECRRDLRRLVAAEASLGEALDGMEPTVDAREVADRALATDEGSPSPTWRVWLPLAAAALLLLALWLPELRDGRVEVPESTSLSTPDVVTDFRVEAPAGRPVTVMQSRDPTVRVIWFHSPTTTAGSTP